MPRTDTPGHTHVLRERLPIAAGPVGLRALRAADIDDFLAYRGDPEVARFQGWQPMDRADSLAFLQAALPCPWQQGDWAQVGIARTADDRLVGDIGLLHEGPTQAQLGFSLARGAQGRGWARAAVQACIDGLLRPLGVTRLRAITDARNAASLRLLLGLGFTPTSREDLVFRGEACTEITLEKQT
jgi:aminoglycoside 6'-N-acetyltransferase